VLGLSRRTRWRSPVRHREPRIRHRRTASAAVPLLLALAACVARAVVAARSDIGLGDDGARVVWLEEWLRHPHAVWTGLWLPAHLYLHALFTLVLRDPIRAGVALSAVAAGGSVYLLARSLQATWGRTAAIAGGIAAAALPVSLAYGATPDVNPVFAFFMIAAVAAVWRAARGPQARLWLVTGWFCLATATWMRFESLALVPLVALLLWPRRGWCVGFALAGAAPIVLWNLANAYLSHGGPLVTMSKDPSLGGSPVSLAFGYLGVFWQA
jgi:4-amino-4-deoxy-L-arabinose transferase-like glycosyltransferase